MSFSVCTPRNSVQWECWWPIAWAEHAVRCLRALLRFYRCGITAGPERRCSHQPADRCMTGGTTRVGESVHDLRSLPAPPERRYRVCRRGGSGFYFFRRAHLGKGSQVRVHAVVHLRNRLARDAAHANDFPTFCLLQGAEKSSSTRPEGCSKAKSGKFDTF